MAKRYKVLLVHNYYKIRGGEDTVVANEKQLLESAGHEVYTYFRRNDEIDTLPLWRKALLPLTTLFSRCTYSDICRLIREKGIDVVHVHNTLLMVSPAVYYAARRCGVPVVQTIHNFRLFCPAGTYFRDGRVCEDCRTCGLHCAVRHSCYRGSKAQSLLCAFNTWLQRRMGLWRHVHFICLTEFNKQKLLELNAAAGRELITPQQVTVKPNVAVRTAHDTPSVPWTERENTVVFAARLDETKGVRVLLEAWKLLGEDAPKLDICGEGDLREWCESFIRDNKLTRVAYSGAVPHEVMMQKTAAAKALVLPSLWYEGFPMTIAEAYAVGTPVIGSDLGNVGDLVRAGGGLVFEAGSPQSLADAVRQMQTAETLPVRGIAGMTPQDNVAALTTVYDRVTSGQA